MKLVDGSDGGGSEGGCPKLGGIGSGGKDGG